MAENKQLVVMYMEGQKYDFSGIKVTIKSLREYYKGDISVILKNVDDRLIEFLNSQNIQVVDAKLFDVLFQTSPYNNKIIYIHLFLEKYKESLKDHDIFYCDMNDVYFKINPFELPHDDVWLSLEDLTFNDCDTNKTWCMVCYGQNVFDIVKHNIVINSGLILGNFSSISLFYQKIIHEMSKVLAKINYPITDQMIVNKLIYVDNFKCILDSKNVNNMAQGIKNQINNKINHQYKVNIDIKNELYNKYE
jgi:hypothetical protein